jgi:integrase
MLGSGLRISEVLALRAEDVEQLDDGRTRIAVRGTIIYDGTVGAVRQDSTKAGRDRYLVVPAWLAGMLVERANCSRSGLLWETRRTAKPYQQQNILRDLRKILRGTDLEWVSSHALRKTAGTAIASSLGVSVATSALGHTSDVVTRRIYLDDEKLFTDVSSALDLMDPSNVTTGQAGRER